MIEHLFVYGTLMPGGPNEHLLTAIGGAWQPATARGKLHRAGWGAAMGYLAIELDAHGDDVNGFVFSSENLSQHWADLDQFEGEAYQRVLTAVRLADGVSIEAYVYAVR